MSSTVDIHSTFDQDEQLEVMGALALRSLFSQAEDPESLMSSPSRYESSVIKNKRRMVSIMDWIAFAFAGDDTDDTAAAALSVEHRSSKFKLYLASNRRPHPRDIENGEKFIRALRESLRLYHEPREDDPDSSALSRAIGPLFAWVSSVASRRLWRDLEAIDDMPLVDPEDPIPVEDQLYRFLVKRSDWEEDESFVKVVTESYPEAAVPNPTGSDSFLFLFKTFISLIRENKGVSTSSDADSPDTGDSVNRVRKLCRMAQFLTHSMFIRARDNEEEEFDENREEWWSTLKKRLLRGAVHLIDIWTLVNHGFPTFERLVQQDGKQAFLETGHGFEIEWVHTQPGVRNDGTAYYWPCTPEEHFRELLSPLHTRRPADELYIFKDAKFMTSLENVWKKGEAVRPYLHCELHLIRFLEQNAIPVYHNVIGVSDPICTACRTYVKNNNQGSPDWVFSETSNTYDPTWLIPDDSPPSKAVVSSIKSNLKSKLEFIISNDWFDSDEGRKALSRAMESLCKDREDELLEDY